MSRVIKVRKNRQVKTRAWLNREIKSALSFFVWQITRGKTPEEAYQQIENAYGFIVAQCAKYHLAKAVQSA